MSSDTLYCIRFNVLMDEIDHFIDDVLKQNGHVPRVETICLLANCLKDFAQKQYDFFMDGFSETTTPGTPKITLMEPAVVIEPRYTKAYVFGRLMRQISADLTILQQAFSTHLFGSDNQKKALERGEKVAQQALALAISAGLINGNTKVLTYFQKTAFVRVIPYASVAVIGIPVTCANDKYDDPDEACINGDDKYRDYLAIPHEIGHYVYWHARLNTDPIAPGNDNRLSRAIFKTIDPENDDLDPTQKTIRCLQVQWQEEIFADIYGCLVAGPVIALAFQDLLIDNYTLLESDGIHPIPLVRPFIYTKVLELMGYSNASGSLQLEWKRKVIVRSGLKKKDSFELRDSAALEHFYNQFISDTADPKNFFCCDGQSKNIPWQDVQMNLESLTERLLSPSQSDLLSHIQPWTIDVSQTVLNGNQFDKNQLFTELFDQFNSFMQGEVLSNSDEDNTADEEGQDSCQSPDFYFNYLYDNYYGTSNLTLPYKEVCQDPRPECYGWTELISQSGWTVGGPECDGTNPP